MPSAYMLRQVSERGFEVVGKISDFKHPDERHDERLARIRHLSKKLEKNAAEMAWLLGESRRTCQAMQFDASRRFMERYLRRSSCFSRRAAQIREFSEKLSRELRERGV